jgi:hypothetical protein
VENKRPIPTSITLALALWLVWSGPSRAQEETQKEPEPASRQEILLNKRQRKQQQLAPYKVSKWEQRVLNYEKRPIDRKIFVKGFQGFRGVIGGMPSGSGFVYGVGYVHGLSSDNFQFTANARRSTRGYTTFDARAEFPTQLSDLPLRAHVQAQYRDLTALGFFGLGSDSSRQNHTFFRMEDRQIGAGLAYNPTHLLELGGEVSLLNLSIGPGSRSPSLETLFDSAQAPGLVEQPEYLIYKGHVAFDFHDQDFRPVGVSVILDLQRYDGRDSDAFDFTRWIAEVQAHVPLGYRNRILALRLRTSHSSADAGAAVPFYLMETIGGAKTLRGFSEYRFRDRRNLLLNAEYRWEVWNYLDFGFFFDAGKVFSDSADLDFSNLHAGYGFGARIHTPGGTNFRVDLARSSEGIHLHISGGPRF